MPISLTDYQLRLLMQAARRLAIEKRSTLLHRVMAQLTLRTGWIRDGDVVEAIRIALQGLQQKDIS
jgi:hypothetical protein